MLKLTKIFREEFGGVNKHFGQHFLVNNHFLDEIVSHIDFSKTNSVVEIGPGCGALTVKLLEFGAETTAIEIDDKLAEFLKRYLFYYDNLHIINMDFLKITPEDLPDKFFFVGNLPYNLSTKILMKTTEFHSRNVGMIFMFQKEVASRINASPGTKDYSWISVVSDYYYNIKRIRHIGGGNFWPKTKVESTVLKFSPKKLYFSDKLKEANFITLVKKAFIQKRKTLKNNLQNEFPDIEAALETLFGNKQIRAEQLYLKDFIALYDYLY
jgi:16S rRNA (adenine1518-N6/adenine1519-N6)-dimethyltransferase